MIVYSPDGTKIKSKPQLARYLGESVDLTTFDFRTGKINANLLRRSKRSRGSDGFGRSYRNDGSLVPPIRQTASIFKQPVTVVKTQSESKVKSELKHGTGERPKQVFWEKRLQNLRASFGAEDMDRFELPKNIRSITGPDLTDDTALRSLATALHLHSQPITGQTCAKSTLEKNPGVFINPEQPLVSAIVISDDDIRRQEHKVKLARRSLQAVIA